MSTNSVRAGSSVRSRLVLPTPVGPTIKRLDAAGLGEALIGTNDLHPRAPLLGGVCVHCLGAFDQGIP